MAFLIINPGKKVAAWEKRIRTLAPEADIRVWPDVGNPNDVEFVLTWNHPRGELKKYSRLKCIASMGAGVDHILRDPNLPRDIPVTRLVDPSMAQSMSEYVVTNVLNYCRHMHIYWENQSQGRWAPRIQRQIRNECVGIMGLGQLGAFTASRLNRMGFPVVGWRRTPQKLDGIDTFFGEAQMDTFLNQVTILVCMLPLTPHTQGILNHDTFNKLQPGSFVINVARGEHLVETDLLEALETDQLAGACLDVFRKEPLPPDHPFWHHPKIRVTPHISSLTNPAAVVPQIVENYRRMIAGQPLLNVIDIEQGY